MKTSALLKLFKENGIKLKERGKHHDLYYSPITNKTSPVPRDKTEIPTRTLNSSIRA
ncbi:MAG: toxin HicA [Clostridiaceae bacterium]|jgi:hypothetical protein|nr:toxin HicA [Clostridiaceae bacterium]